MGCKDDAGLRSRCDLVRKDSGRDVQLTALLGSLQGSALPGLTL